MATIFRVKQLIIFKNNYNDKYTKLNKKKGK